MTPYKKNKNLHEDILSFINENIDVFEPNYQSKFLKVFIDDKKNWAQQIIDIVFPEYFDGFHKVLVDYEMEFFNKYRVPADYDDLKEMVNDKEKDELLKEHIYGLIDKIKELEIDPQKSDSIKERAYKYFKSQKVKSTLIECAVDWKKNTFDGIKGKMEDALKAGEPKDSGHDYVRDIKKRLRKDFRNPVSILPGLDEHIGKGVASGELFVVIAPTGGGKSMMLVRNGVAALKAGKKVIYFTLELSEEIVGQRFDACFNNIPLNKVEYFEELIAETANEFKVNLKIKKFADGTATINTLYAHLDWLKCNENFIPEIIIVDYADNMKALQKGELLRHELVDIYRALRAMADEFNVPVLTASQTSGDGYSKKEIDMGMTAEAKAKNNIADIVIGFGRDDMQVRDGKATLKILKNRNGAIGRILELTFDSRVLMIEVITPVGYTKVEKGAMIGAESSKVKAKDAKNIGSYMSNVAKTLDNQSFTPEVKD